jgi:hypothetical protein
MDWKEFLEPDIRKIILFILPIIFLTVVYIILWITKNVEWIGVTPVNFIIFHFPCFLESKLFCHTSSCCFVSITTQVGSSLIFYLPWFLFSWFIVWANDKVELRGYLWRKLQEKIPPRQIKLENPLPGEMEIVKKEQFINSEETLIKKEKEKIANDIDDLNIRKMLEIGLDMNQGLIRCSNCKSWEPTDKKRLSKMIKKHGIDIIWKYKCKDCRKTNK